MISVDWEINTAAMHLFRALIKVHIGRWILRESLRCNMSCDYVNMFVYTHTHTHTHIPNNAV